MIMIADSSGQQGILEHHGMATHAASICPMPLHLGWSLAADFDDTTTPGNPTTGVNGKCHRDRP